MDSEYFEKRKWLAETSIMARKIRFLRSELNTWGLYLKGARLKEIRDMSKRLSSSDILAGIYVTLSEEILTLMKEVRKRENRVFMTAGKYSILLLRHYVDGVKVDLLAKEIGVSRSTLERNIGRAVRSLRIH